MRRWLAGPLLTLALLLPAWGQEQYRGLPFPPDEVYEAMLGYADQGGFAGLSACLRHVRPLSAALKERFQADPEAEIRSAVARGSRGLARQAVLRMIFADLRYNLQEAAAAEDAARRAESVRLASLDYSFLAPSLKASDQALDRAARGLLNRLLRTAQRRQTAELCSALSSLLAPSFAPRSPHENP